MAGALLLAVTVLRPASVTPTAPVAPAFTLPLLAGRGHLSLRSLRGHRVLLNFWASYCEACKQEMPTLEAAYRRYRAQGVVLVGIDTLGDVPSAARDLVRRMGLTIPMIVDSRQDVADHYNVAGLPTSIFIDSAGRLRGAVTGPLDAITLRCGLGVSAADACASGRLIQTSTDAAWAGPGAPKPDIVWRPGKWRAPNFLLTNQDGRRVSLTSLRGHVVALDFLSVSCTGTCPVEGRKLARTEALLGPQRAGVDLITISVEPETDSLRAAIAFGRTAGLDRRWQYLTDTRRALRPVWHAYYVAAAPPPVAGRPEGDPLHSVGLYLIDRHGFVRAYFDAPTSGRVAAAILGLLG